MQKLIELYEMVSLNDAALRSSEKLEILKARRALDIFERTMENFKTISPDAPTAAKPSFHMAACSVCQGRKELLPGF